MVIELTHMAPTGEAISKSDGMVYFVPYGAPGDLVDVEIVHQRRHFARARIKNVLRPSTFRTIPVCPYFGSCGGCDWQHIEYAEQLHMKAQAVQEQFRRIGRFKDVTVQSTIPSPVPYSYRNHTQFVLTSNAKPGYHRSESASIVNVEHCAIIDPALDHMLHQWSIDEHGPLHLQSGAKANNTGSDPVEVHLRVGVNTGETAAYVNERDQGNRRNLDQDTIHEVIGNYTYRISPESFFQVNTAVAALIVEYVIAKLGLSGQDSILDLYCGVGLFTLPIAARAKSVLGIESNQAAAADAISNLALFMNATIATSDVATALATINTLTKWNAVVVDPPRAGIDRIALTEILRLKAPLILYVSCDPATLARDARMICDDGYRVDAIQPFDMFPQTHHVETVTTFMLVSAA